MADFRVHHLRFFEYTPKAIHCLAYEAVHQKIALSRSDGSIEIWDVKDNWYQEKVLPGAAGQSVEALVWCNKRLFSAGLHGYLQEHDLLHCRAKLAVPSNSGAIWCLAVDESQTQIAAGTEDGCIVLFSIVGDEVLYERSLDKQEGRILSIAWHSGNNVIISGGVDNIRIWSVSSGHAVQRLTPGRQERNKETIIWAIAVTKDFTIVSGDSRGKTCFWNGKQGTLLKSFQSHKADVLAVAMTPDGSTVFSSGIDSSLTQFDYTAAQPNSDWKMWVRSIVRCQHTHDVRAIAVTDDSVVTAGVDCQLIFNHLASKKGIKTWHRIPPVPHHHLVHVARAADVTLFQYHNCLELWKLGSTNRRSERNGEILQLHSQPIKLLQLKAKGDEPIVCSAISADASLVVYSDATSLRFFSTVINTEMGPKISVTKIKSQPAGLLPSHSLQFTPDGSTLVSVTYDGQVQILKMREGEIEILHTLPSIADPAPGIHLVAVSQSGKHFAVGDHNNAVHIYNLKHGKHISSLPAYHCHPSAICFHPCLPELLVAYTDQKIYEYNFSDHEYTSWSRQCSRQWHPQWLKRTSKITQVCYLPSQPHLILIHDEQMLCIINKQEPFPSSSEKIYNKSSWSTGHQNHGQKHAFHFCSKFKYLMHVEPLSEDFLLVVERPPLAIFDTLPAALKEKKFGT